MNATSTLVLILVLSFAAERVARAIIFLLNFLPAWKRRFPEPLFIRAPDMRLRAKNRLIIAQTVLVGLIAGAVVWYFPDLHIIQMLTGPGTNSYIDVAVTVIVVMGGSDLVARLLDVTGMGQGGTAGGGSGASRAQDPIEINGRLVLESESVFTPVQA